MTGRQNPTEWMQECLVADVHLEQNLESSADSLEEMFLVGQIQDCSCSPWVSRSQMIQTPQRIQKHHLFRFASLGTVKMTPKGYQPRGGWSGRNGSWKWTSVLVRVCDLFSSWHFEQKQFVRHPSGDFKWYIQGRDLVWQCWPEIH